MRIILFSLFIFVLSSANAQLCIGVFNNFAPDKQKLSQRIEQKMSDLFASNLRFNMLLSSPFLPEAARHDLKALEIKDPEHWILSRNSSRFFVKLKNWRGKISSSVDQLKAPEFWGNHVSEEHFLNSTYDSYEGRIAPDIIAELKAAKTDSVYRMNFAFIRNLKFVDHQTFEKEQYGEYIGTARVYDGIPSRHSILNQDGTAITWSVPADLPFERVMTARGIKTTTSSKLQRQREQNPHAEIFEIGKLSVTHDHPEREKVRALLDLFILREFLINYPNGDFYVHVSDRAHSVLYQRTYGFKVVEDIDVNGNKEQILHIKGKDLAQRIVEINKLDL